MGLQASIVKYKKCVIFFGKLESLKEVMYNREITVFEK